MSDLKLQKDQQNALGKVSFISIQAHQEGQRIDNFLLKKLKPLPKSRLYRIIRKGEVRVNKKRIKPDYRLKAGDDIRIPPITGSVENRPLSLNQKLISSISKRVIYEDKHLLVLDKPTGLAVHSGSGLKYGIIDLMRAQYGEQIELLHRLDRDTSGILLLAKQRETLLVLQQLLQSRQFQKNYQAVVHGQWDEQLVNLQQPLKKIKMPNGERRVRIDELGQSAATEILKSRSFRIGEQWLSWLEIRLHTGRTHQIRVHCQHAGHEIVGDDKYGNRLRDKQLEQYKTNRLMLHASRLIIPDNDLTGRLVLDAPLPDSFNPFMTFSE